MCPVTVVGRILHRFLYVVVCLAVLGTGVARAQEAPPPAYIALIEGVATLEREGEVTPAVVNMPLIPGDRVRTTAGRVEIRFPDGTGIEVAEDSAVELITPTRVRLLAGTLDRLEPLQANVNALSASYLPRDLQMYGATFDQYGTWRYAPDYGNVWYPMVSPDWRPYYNGYWEPIRPYGWTWIGADVWAWPTHHYGRWGFARNAWFWVPDRTFAAAWVSWGSAPGYVSWCPLGFDNRPVFALSMGYGNPWAGWTVLPRTHFGAHGYYAPHYAVEPRHLPQHTVFVTQSVPPVAVPRHLGNGAPGGGGVAVPRNGSTTRAGAFASRPSPVNSEPSPVAIPPIVTGQPTRAGTWPSQIQRPRPSEQPRVNGPWPAAVERRPMTNDRRPSTYDDRRPTSDPRPPTNDYRVAVPRAGTAPFAPPPPLPAPSMAMPRAGATSPPPSPAPAGIPRASQAPPPPPPSPPPQAAPQRSAPSGGGHDRAGAPAQPRGGDNQPRGGESRAVERRRG
jgi:hypothetical protein